MEEALTLEKLNRKISNKYEYDEKRIVGIIMARYDLKLTQSIIDGCYLYWHENTGKVLDFFWAGYGKYLCPDDENKDKIILKFDGNDNRVYYDRKAFISIKNEFNNIFKKAYQDKVQLILVNYKNGKLRFDESIKIDLEENFDENFSNIRELVEFITDESTRCHDVLELAKMLKNKNVKKHFKNKLKGITFSDIIGTGIGFLRL